MYNFNPRAPYGARRIRKNRNNAKAKFQSTRPIRGATITVSKSASIFANFNPRAPYGARLLFLLLVVCLFLFQSTRPIRGATVMTSYIYLHFIISIHAPHTGRDWLLRRVSRLFDISIHAPHTGRDPTTTREMPRTKGFQSTRPIRGATLLTKYMSSARSHFNPRAPYGARRTQSRHQAVIKDFNPRAPYGARRKMLYNLVKIRYFNPRAPYGARLSGDTATKEPKHFNPRAPYGARQQKCIIYVLHFCNNRQLKHKNQQETSSVRTFF